MDFVNKGLAQLQDLLRSMTPGARITAGLLLAVVVISLAYLFNHQIAGGDTYLLGGQSFSAGELSAMEAAFGKAGLNSYTLDGARIRIAYGQQASYMAALADSGALPAHFGSYLDAALQSDSPWTSSKQREERLKIAKQQELALVIRAMSGIENAAVHYDTKKAAGFRQDVITTASVSVKPLGNVPLDPKQVPMIRHLVAGAIAGLTPDSVTVIDLNGRTYSGSTADGFESAMDDPYLARMKEHQANFENTIRNALSYVRGATVTVNVELNKELRHVQDKETIDPKSVTPLMTRTDSKSLTSESAAVGGQPGLAAQGPNTAARLGGGGGTNTNESNDSSETQNAVGRDRTQVTMAPLTLKRVTVAVGVPNTYYEEIWRQRNPTPEGEEPKKPDATALAEIQREETEKIRSHVSGIIPPPAEASEPNQSLVTVTTFEHIADSIPTESIVDNAMGWFNASWSTLGMMGLAGVSLLMLRSMVRGGSTPGPAPAPALAAETAAAADELDDLQPTDRPKPKLKRRLGSGPNLRDELAEMVREDPEAAANILRGWIGKAG